MQLSKIIVLLLGGMIALTSPNTFSSEPKKPLVSAHTGQKKATAHLVKNKQNKPVKNTNVKHSKTTKSKKTDAKKSTVKKAVSTKPTAKKVVKHKKTSAHKTVNKKPKISAKNETKKHYGVNGAKLTHVKVTNKTYRYRAKNKTHTSINREKSRQFSQTGVASYYGGMFHGRKTASGEIFNKNSYTAAHKTLALGSYVLVTNLRNGRKVIVRINDRGPFSHNRIIDLSVNAAREIGMLHSGVAKVKIEAMQVDKQGYISGKGAQSLYKLAKNSGLPLKVKGSGKDFAIKAE